LGGPRGRRRGDGRRRDRRAAYSPEVRVAELYALGLRSLADVAENARVRRLSEPEETAMAAGDALLGGGPRPHAEVLATRPVFVPVSDAWVRLCEAEAARLHRDPDPDAWARRSRAWDAIRRPYLAAYSRWREAEARAGVARRPDEAKARSEARLDIATRLGAEPLAARDHRAGGPGSADAGRGADRGAFGGRQPGRRRRRAVRPDCTANASSWPRRLGRTNRQIAGELFISENTAGVHVSRILGKLDVAGRGEAAAIAYRLGMVEPVRESA
jgi:hypothetical protein